jgi:hypothetical protein
MLPSQSLSSSVTEIADTREEAVIGEMSSRESTYFQESTLEATAASARRAELRSLRMRSKYSKSQLGTNEYGVEEGSGEDES